MLFSIGLALTCVVGVVSSAFVQHEFSSSNPDNLAPIVSAQNAEIIPNEYIVMLNDAAVTSINDINAFVSDLVPQQEDILKVYPYGFAATLSEESLQTIRSRPEVAFVEPNSVVSIFAVQHNPPSWGLARIYQKSFRVKDAYVYQDTAGSNVDVYVIDTGVFVDHEAKYFEGRATWGYTAPAGDDDTDGNGHGTHVAGTIAGSKYGVAKNANIIAVKVLRSSGTGTMADVIDGVSWAASQASQSGRRSAANMSLGGGRSAALDRAVKNAILSGLHFAVAAGNSNTDACYSSPSGVEEAVTVGASTKEDTRAYFSNYGKCVDIFGPGHYITSAWIGGSRASRTISGTSMASPHVAGVMALLLSENDYTPKQLKAKLEAISFKDVLSGIPRNTVNRLLNNNAVTKEDTQLYY